MTIMSRKQERLLDQLIELAGGDVALVETALREAPRDQGEAPRLEEVVRFIVEKRREAIEEQRELEPA